MKERLVGATILLVLLVLLVPELLSGPTPPPTVPLPAAVHPEEPVGPAAVRNVTVDLLAGHASQEAQAASSPADPSQTDPSAVAAEGPAAETPARDEPAPADALHRRDPAPPTVTTLGAQQAAAPAPDHELSPSTSAPRAPASAGASRTPAAAPAPPAPHGWAVQVGSFASRANAQSLARRLKPHEPAYVSASGKGAALRYRVRIGPIADRGAAERVRLKLVKGGYAASLVPP
ncbi:MAG: SPOR domain-containing protein [Pseudomonadota bacterium]|nr:SPOR domain-containing protein [Pseudomonadota bacterium]